MLTDDQRVLAADPEAVRMARGYARRFAARHPYIDPDEFESAAMVGVIFAAMKFDGRGRFSGFAVAKVVGRCRDVIRGAHRRFRNVPTVPLADRDRADAGVTDHDDYHAALADPHPPAGYFDEQHEEVEACLRCLCVPEHRELVRDLFLRCRDEGQQTRVAARRGVSQTAVFNQLARLSVRLRAVLAARGVLVTRGAA